MLSIKRLFEIKNDINNVSLKKKIRLILSNKVKRAKQSFAF